MQRAEGVVGYVVAVLIVGSALVMAMSGQNPPLWVIAAVLGALIILALTRMMQ